MPLLKQVLFVILSCLFLRSSAQFVTLDSESPKFKKFLNSTTLVVLQEDDERYNAELKSALKKYWTVTPYDFIRANEVKTYAVNDNFSIILTLSLNSQGYENLHSTYLAVMVCGPKLLDANGFPITVAAKVVIDTEGSCSSCYNNTDNTDINVYQLSRAISIAKENKLIQKDQEAIRKLYITDRGLIAGKTLAVHSNIFRPAGSNKKKWLREPEFAALYPYKYKAVNDKEIDKILKGHDSTYAVLYKQYDPVNDEKYLYLVVDARTGNVLYMPRQTKEVILDRKQLDEMLVELK